jgi:hypothetical protein
MRGTRYEPVKSKSAPMMRVAIDLKYHNLLRVQDNSAE